LLWRCVWRLLWRCVLRPDLDLLEANALRSVGEVGYFTPCLIIEVCYVGVSAAVSRRYAHQRDEPLSSVKRSSVPSSDWCVPWKIVPESCRNGVGVSKPYVV
jgi:hypothetical protein